MSAESAELPLDEAPELPITTAMLEDMLRAKYPRDRYALFYDVPDAVSLDARRRIDAVAIGIWKSVGREVQAFELKASRSDWLREVKQVNKADPFVAICDRFWLVTADPKIAKLEEIPACWGWLSATKSGLRVQRPAQKIPTDHANMPWGFTVGLLRKLQDDLLSSPDVRSHINAQIEAATGNFDQRVQWAAQRAADDLKRNQDAIAEFEKASGIQFKTYSMGSIGAIVGQLQKLGYGESGGLREVPHLLEGQANALRVTLEQVEEVRAALAALTEASR